MHTYAKRWNRTVLPACAMLLSLSALTACTTDQQTASQEPAANHSSSAHNLTNCEALPEGFTTVAQADPSIATDIRYATTNNFTGEVVEGYQNSTEVVLRTDAAQALATAQEELSEQGLGLLVFDGLRPTRAVDNFVEWSTNDDANTKAEYYPSYEKPELFELGYIAKQSGHSLGGTVDLTIIDLDSGDPLDMGGEFDFFDVRSHYETSGLSVEQAANRTLLHDSMIKAGFAPYAEEWWHFSYPVPAEAERLDFNLAEFNSANCNK